MTSPSLIFYFSQWLYDRKHMPWIHMPPISILLLKRRAEVLIWKDAWCFWTPFFPSPLIFKLKSFISWSPAGQCFGLTQRRRDWEILVCKELATAESFSAKCPNGNYVNKNYTWRNGKADILSACRLLSPVKSSSAGFVVLPLPSPSSCAFPERSQGSLPAKTSKDTGQPENDSKKEPRKRFSLWKNLLCSAKISLCNSVNWKFSNSFVITYTKYQER